MEEGGGGGGGGPQVEGRGGMVGEGVAGAVEGGADSVTEGKVGVGGDSIAGETKAAGAEIGGVSLAVTLWQIPGVHGPWIFCCASAGS
jgi:hypothetical protein